MDKVASDLLALRTAAKKRKVHAYRPGTHRNHSVVIRTYFAFCIHYSIQDIPLTVDTVTLFVEFLARTFMSAKSIINYLYGLKYLCLVLEQPVHVIQSFQVQLTVKALKRTLPGGSNVKLPIHVDMLKAICHQVIKLFPGKLGIVLRCAYTFAFFTLLRVSNLAPYQVSQFDPHRQLCRNDVLFTTTGLAVLVKWSKTRQENNFINLIPLSPVPDSNICPVKAFQSMIKAIPAHTQAPLFTLQKSCITASQLNTCLRHTLASIDISPASYSMHSFRRGGTTFSIQSGLSLPQLKARGDWRSDAFWTYYCPEYKSKVAAANRVAQAASEHTSWPSQQ